MIPKYDINDPNDIALLKGLKNQISNHKWQDHFDFSNSPEYQKSFTYDDRGILLEMIKNRNPTPKQIIRALNIVGRIEALKNQEENATTIENSVDKNGNNPFEKDYIKPKHITIRLAWHDNKWNGNVCSNPELNTFCNGYHSLLSDRIRRRKEANMDKENKYKGKPLEEVYKQTGYLPPCFWSTNVFGEQSYTAVHDNPAAPQLDKIRETLPPFSVFTWPFSFSFTRTREEKLSGGYPSNLESVRVPYFKKKIQINKSIGFLYTKFSNPLSGEEMKYLLVGCGMIVEEGEPAYFGPKSEIDKIRKRSHYNKNFPTINWAIKYSFDPNTIVRMPYHEYLDYVDNGDLGKDDLDKLIREKYLEKIKVTINEEELIHCFKFVAMDIDDDEAIFLLYKMRKKLLDCESDGIVSIESIREKISNIDGFLKYCWEKRGYLPGFENLSSTLLDQTVTECRAKDLINELRQKEQNYVAKLLGLIKDPDSEESYNSYNSFLWDLNETIELRGISAEQFIKLSMLNLTLFQFSRIVKGDLKKEFRRSIKEISDNPYMLFEAYEQAEEEIDEKTGEEIDRPIDIFKIDIAYFPDSRYMNRIKFQRDIKGDDKRRLRALIANELRSLVDYGHCFQDANEIQESIKNYPLFYKIDTEFQLSDDFLLKLDSEYLNHFDLFLEVIYANDTNYFYLKDVYNAEKAITQIIHGLLRREENTLKYENLEQYLDKSINVLKSKMGDNFDESSFKTERIELYKNIFKNRFFVLSGSPGSGKSHELLNIIKYLTEKGEDYLLLTPTGKAALRLSTDPHFREIKAFTIDKVCTEYTNSPSKRSQYKNIIIDEMSMVDLIKLNKILGFFNFESSDFRRLIFVGDIYQLPSIGFGKVLSDVISFLTTNKHEENHIYLDANCRLELANSILPEFSKVFSTNEELTDEQYKKISEGGEVSTGFKIRYWDSKNELYDQLTDEFDLICQQNNIHGNYNEKLNMLLGLDKEGSININNQSLSLEKFQLLSPYRRNFFGADDINDYIQNSFKKDIEFINDLFKQSDKIIRTANYYDNKQLILSNGSIGVISKENKDDVLYFDELNTKNIKYKDIRRFEREAFELAFCITVHKSQGSGFENIFLIIPKKYSLLSKELLYTGLTRTKKAITIFVEGKSDQNFDDTLFGYIRKRTYTENRRTSLLLDYPYKTYSLEPETGVYVQSRAEYIIYTKLKLMKEKLGIQEFDFTYEKYPEVNGQTVRIKTDFTVFRKDKKYYWEHLGLLGIRSYEKKWIIKHDTYKRFSLLDNLLTTDEKNGINESKIDQIINAILEDKLENEDRAFKYSLHHYSLR